MALKSGDVSAVELPSGGGEDSAGGVAVALWGRYGFAKSLVALILPIDAGGPCRDAGGHHVLVHRR